MTVTVHQTRSSTTRLPVLVACLSMLYGVLGLVWLVGAEHVGAGLVAVLGFLGVPAALGHTWTEWSPTAYRPLLGFTALQVVVFGFLAPSVVLFDWNAFGEVGSRPLLVFGALLLGAGWAVLGVRGLRSSRRRP